MASFKIDNLKIDDSGNIISGSAILQKCQRELRNGKNKPITSTIESLGKILYLAPDHRSGIFFSKTRGLFYCNAETEEFSEVESNDSRIVDSKIIKKPNVHTSFGDVYFLLKFLENDGFLKLLKNTFDTKWDYKKTICHILFTIVNQNGKGKISKYFQESFLSALMPDVVPNSLESDTRYFEKMGDDDIKMKFFKEYIKLQKSKDSNFGKACYADSTPLPNEVINCYKDALCNHGVDATSRQVRLVLILDKKTNLPVWFTIYTGNVLDYSTIKGVMLDVKENLGIEIEDVVLDAGYVCQDTIKAFCSKDSKINMTARLPERKGFKVRESFNIVNTKFYVGKYIFRRKGHTYFGKKINLNLFGENRLVYAYLDRDNAEAGFAAYYDRNEEEYRKMSESEKTWSQFQCGYFVLISNQDDTPENILDKYLERGEIESFFKCSKQHTDMLPIYKHNEKTIEGKILSDMISTLIYSTITKEMTSKNKDLTDLLFTAKSMQATILGDKKISLDTPNKQVKDLYKEYSIKIPFMTIAISDLQNQFLF